MAVELLGAACYRAPLGPAPDGRDGASHFALIEFADGNERRAFVKLYPNDLQIVNEAIGHILARASGHAVPDRAAVVYAPTDRLPQPLPRWLSDAGASEWPAWCSTLVPRDSLKIFYRSDPAPIRKELAESDQTPAIVAFDDWLANVDRNVGNLLRLARGRYALIDHGRIIAGQEWPTTRPSATSNYPNTIQALLGQTAAALPFKSRTFAAAAAHPEALRSARRQLDRWWSILDDETRRYIEEFLTRRSHDEHALRQRLRLLL